MSPETTPLPIAVWISGGGTTLRNLIERKKSEDLPIDIRLVISSSPSAKGLQYAADEKIPALVIEKKKGIASSDYEQQMFEPCRAAGVRYVVMAGFLKHVTIPADFENRVINIHPSLIPAFCGQGMYGLKVHQAAIDYGAKISGCTVHFVDNHYDHGPIVGQWPVPVRDEDTAESLQARVFATECEAYPAVLRALATGEICVSGRRIGWRR
ncbi:phosphoribosylglycinamide formyltransferase [Anatilimnocola floriformis]|uniref:phosphoribosylglycinamide formyltransferase n=1 Tax=Anatilimnocola floriformis TaxID=2948575 RepID=UPI0020C4A8FA|nr:phosphoribosylglycinamide formyltransferase [Anatilimnocola floriformis]